jgi:hypothetical protein
MLPQPLPPLLAHRLLNQMTTQVMKLNQNGSKATAVQTCHKL